MEATLLSARLNEAAAQGREITLLLRGAHRLVVTGASVEASSGGTVGLDLGGRRSACGGHGVGLVVGRGVDLRQARL